MDQYNRETKTAVRAAIEASVLCQRVRKGLVADVSITKSDRSPVTVADYGSQAIICRIIREVFPEDPIIAEEDSKALKKTENSRILEQVTHYVSDVFAKVSSKEVCEWIDLSSHALQDRFWALDPIDGTKGFLRGDQYAIALALIENRRVQLGILACPNLHVVRGHPQGEKGCLFFARRGSGSLQMDMSGEGKRTLSVSKISDPAEAFFTESFESSHSDHLFHQRIANKFNMSKPPLRMDSQAKYGIVARGEAVLYLRIPAPSEPGYRENIWDHAAGAIITEEAGGKVTDATGKPLDFISGIKMKNNYGVVVSNGILHDRVIEALGFKKENA